MRGIKTFKIKRWGQQNFRMDQRKTRYWRFDKKKQIAVFKKKSIIKILDKELKKIKDEIFTATSQVKTWVINFFDYSYIHKVLDSLDTISRFEEAENKRVKNRPHMSWHKLCKQRTNTTKETKNIKNNTSNNIQTHSKGQLFSYMPRTRIYLLSIIFSSLIITTYSL